MTPTRQLHEAGQRLWPDDITRGLPAIEECLFAGLPSDVTLLFSLGLPSRGRGLPRDLERRVQDGLNPAVTSVASVFVSRWDKAVADRVLTELRHRLGITEAARAHRAYRMLLDSPRWGRLANESGHPQRLLWASTPPKDATASDVLYVSALAAQFTVNTMPAPTLLAFHPAGLRRPRPGRHADCRRQRRRRAGPDHPHQCRHRSPRPYRSPSAAKRRALSPLLAEPAGEQRLQAPAADHHRQLTVSFRQRTPEAGSSSNCRWPQSSPRRVSEKVLKEQPW